MEYKLVIDPIVIGEDYILGGYGSIGGAILQPSGQWLDFLPDIESQLNNNGFDALACATFGTLNAVEILHRQMYGVDKNWSDRFLARASETTRNGNSPHKVAETLRQIGAPAESEYPYSSEITTWEQFYADIPSSVYTLAEKFLGQFDFKHEYVVTQPYYIKQALQFSPVGVSVCAWFQDENGLFYKPAGMTDNHWVCIVGYKEGEYWLVFDSYNIAGQGNESFIKKVKWDTPFQIAKRFSLPVHDEKPTIIAQVWQALFSNGLASYFPGWLADFLNPKNPVSTPTPPTETPVPPPFPPTPMSKYDWSTPLTARHSARVMCDEAGLSWGAKQIITACIMQESRFHPDAKGPVNENGTRDWGLCQYNDGKNSKGQAYWIGPGADFASTEEVLNDPEKNVRVMIREYKKGNIKRWSSYSTGAYKQWL